MQLKGFLPILLAGVIGGGVVDATYEIAGKWDEEPNERENIPAFTRTASRSNMHARLPTEGAGNAVQNAVQPVVHIRAEARMQPGLPDYYQLPEPFRHLFGLEPYEGQPPSELREQTGSGVIVSKDG